VATLVRYGLATAGAIGATRMLGIGWSHVQWLVAGMTVGLGFGLQEIFANFISGLILLFERPIRLGDTVTVGDITGSVTKLRIRSTTITDGARRELVVPNKEFITGKLINWTLSDRVARVQVSIGVGYGTDPELAMRTLLDVAAAHPLALKEPPPSASFEGFGPNALDFKLAAYVANLDDAGKTKNELNSAIVRAFRAAGIECAAPRCDVVVRGLEGEILELGRAMALRKSA
jgi:potassium efflux system protein